MKTNFESYLLGLYNNKSQAQSHPTEYSQVYILWERVDGGYHSKQWYRKDGEDKPYREKYHKIVEVSETEVIVENYYLDWERHSDCDMIFTFKDHKWYGKLLGDQCIVRDAKVISEFNLTGSGIESRDKGVNSEGEIVFGGVDLYKFIRGA
ncbi:antenna protein [Synechococcus phage S-MbCM6]|jgi:hypothetical protein|uniref:Antenna protein n=3 Tax=Namakavirus smbcm6 TaxID=2734120 RepID=H8ZMB8_9CAUD|nr:CpeT-like antenna protein [Synechococcus phage ACG-2014c]AHB80647.1 antenna protein [Synechococcus phage S-MbCM25]AFD02629.1 CpeT antenna protein [Synechococcus phage ACG-2014c]AIX14406.1 antenna protein [Synechococcus phage ACG-2014c]AIX22566.1 antenna protein [Synechococcus phage ACG-2014c]AIX22780.1 antenna protein [Synechococcus phage ACG-2014c]